MYHLIVIFLYRPLYRTASEPVPTPAERCDSAALSILELLRTFDETHGVCHGPMTLSECILRTSFDDVAEWDLSVQITIAAATIFALRSLSPSHDVSSLRVTDAQRLQDCVSRISP